MNIQSILPAIPSDANKYSRGSLLILAGSQRYFGAGVLATLAAEKTGTGYVSLATPADAAVAAKHHLLCSPVIAVPDVPEGKSRTDSMSAASLPGILKELRKIDAICCGPGLTVNEDTTAFVHEVLDYAAKSNIPLLLDADALNIVAAQPEFLDNRCGHAGKDAVSLVSECAQNELILTPHTGELARLAAKKKNLNSVPEVMDTANMLAHKWNATIVAKGSTTCITNGEQQIKSSKATPALAKAGTGDVLAGIIGSLLAQGVSVTDAAILGVHIHSMAGNLAEQKQGRRSVTALDVIDAIPAVLVSYEAD